MLEGITGILMWVGLFGIIALLFVGFVLGVLFFGMRLYYPDEHPTDKDSLTNKGEKPKRP